jgi:hypothetical protein
MSMYRTVDTSIWKDPWFADLKPLAKTVFLYAITNDRQTACGTFEASLKQMAYEIGVGLRQLEDALLSLAPKVVWWGEHNVVWVRSFYKHQRAKSSGKFATAATNALTHFPLTVQEAVATQYPELGKGMDTLSIPYRYPMDTHTNKATEAEAETEAETEEPASFAPDAEKVEDLPIDEPEAMSNEIDLDQIAREVGFTGDAGHQFDQWHAKHPGEQLTANRWRGWLGKAVKDGYGKHPASLSSNGRQGPVSGSLNDPAVAAKYLQGGKFGHRFSKATEQAGVR